MTAPKDTAEDLVTVERLVRSLGQATVDVPNLKTGEALARTKNWRRMPTPWLEAGAASGVAITMALAENEVEAKAVALPTGATWQPDAHTWNMNEGAFYSRDTLFAPTPATLTFQPDAPGARAPGGLDRAGHAGGRAGDLLGDRA